MDSCLKLVSCALSAILKWAHLHNKQFCEKGFAPIHQLQLGKRPCFGIQLNLAWSQDWKLNSTFFQLNLAQSQDWELNSTSFFLTKEQFSCPRNRMFEICSNGFSHFKLSQPGCKSSSPVNGLEKCWNRVFKFRLKPFLLRLLKIFYIYHDF